MSAIKTLSMTVLIGMLAAPVFASHANPWATEDDNVLAKNHDANQARSIDTPGEDEMRGAMVGTAKGKTSGLASNNSGLAPDGGSSHGAGLSGEGAGHGNGSGNGGGAGHGAGDR